MYYIVVSQLNKVIAWSNKCGGSSMRRQLAYDLQDQEWITAIQNGTGNGHEMLKQRFKINPLLSTVPMHYQFQWYVRDPFYRILSCFINRKIIVEGCEPDVTFKDFITNLEHYRSISGNIRSHTEPQMDNYFDAPWDVIDINLAKFSFSQKMNSTKYTLGDKLHAWNMPSKDLVVDKATYSPISFYSQEISSMIKNFYREDYEFLRDKIRLV